MKRHANLSFFVPHLGCPHACVFCDQKNISGETNRITPEDVRNGCEAFLPKQGGNTEIAFFGGSFTAIDRETMTGLLEAAYPFVKEGRACGIRCSTRPDAISPEILDILRSYGVTSVELGAQSMDDDVLRLNGRGHDSLSVEKASGLIKQWGINLGLQMMVGMYGEQDYAKGAWDTACKIAALEPSTVRIYPTLVVDGTALGYLYKTGKYIPLTVDEAVEITAGLMKMFREKDINVIRVGLHYEESLENTVLAGPFHPAFGELCENRIYRDKLDDLTRGMEKAEVLCEQRLLSQVQGQKKSNIEYFRSIGREIKIIPDAAVIGIKLKTTGEST